MSVRHDLNLDVYTAANSKYESFIPIFIWSTLRSNPRAKCTIGVENIEAVTSRHAMAFDWLQAHFGERFELFEVDFSISGAPNSVRFLEFPVFSSDYVYICDIDFLITEDIVSINEKSMRKSGLPFNNIVRPNTTRLTGLHFTRTEALWAPLSKGLQVAEELLRGNDEELLYHLVSEKLGLTGNQLEGGSRPSPGLRISLFSRFPLGGIDPLSGESRVAWVGVLPKNLRSILDLHDILEFEEFLQPESLLLLTLARSWALASIAAAESFLDPDLVPALSGDKQKNSKAAKRIKELQIANCNQSSDVTQSKLCTSDVVVEEK